MNLRTPKLAMLVLATITALAALAPAADAGGSRKWKDRDYRESRYRSYFYHDPYCGRTHAHISAFKAHYDRAHHPPIIRKVDRHTGRIIKAYAWNGRSWRDASYARYDRNRFDDRYAYRH